MLPEVRLDGEGISWNGGVGVRPVSLDFVEVSSRQTTDLKTLK